MAASDTVQTNPQSQQVLPDVTDSGATSDLKYPETLDQTLEFPHILAYYATKLVKEAADVFEPSEECPLHFCNLTVGKNGAREFKEEVIAGLSKLQAHLSVKEQDAVHKYIYVTAESSRSPLSCTKEEMDLILRDYQVMASFVDLLLAFRGRETPYHLATFRVEDHLDHTFQRQELKPFNGSGIRTQHCFNVLGIEKNGKGEWQPRQVAAYHSFDIQEGRSAWIIMKGNDIIRNRHRQAVDGATSRDLQSFRSSHDAFGQTLRDQLLILQWCTEGWEDYLETMEENCRDATVITRSSNIQGLVDDVPKWREKHRVAVIAGQNKTPANPGLIRKVTHRVSGLPNTLAAGPPRRQDTFTVPNKKLTAHEVLESLRTLRCYSVKMQDMMSRLEQNTRVVESIMTRYHNLVRSRKFTQHLKKDQIRSFREHADDFEAQLRIISGSLESFRTRMRSVHDSMTHEGDVFNHIMQAFSMSTAEYYATSSRQSTDAMQDMTEHMHHKTVSMHVITIFTLIFLPGTFVATIFSSGILTFGNEGDVGFGEKMGDWKVRIAGVKLFFAICLPLLFLTLSAWFAVYWLARREGHREEKKQEDVEALNSKPHLVKPTPALNEKNPPKPPGSVATPGASPGA